MKRANQSQQKSPWTGLQDCDIDSSSILDQGSCIKSPVVSIKYCSLHEGSLMSLQISG